MSWPVPIRVVAVGSPQGDDAVAWAVLRQLKLQRDWSADVEFHAIEGGQRLLEILDGTGSLVLLDALATTDAPGKIYRFTWPNPRIDSLSPGTTHLVRPAEALHLAETLGLLPGRVAIWAIVGESFSPERDMSAAVAEAVPVVIEGIVGELRG